MNKRTIKLVALAVGGSAILFASIAAVFISSNRANVEVPPNQKVQQSVEAPIANPTPQQKNQREFLITPILSEAERDLYREAEDYESETKFDVDSFLNVVSRVQEIEDFRARIDVELHSTLGGEDPLRSVMQEYIDQAIKLASQPEPHATEALIPYLASVDCALAIGSLRETGDRLPWVVEVVETVEERIFSDLERRLVPPIRHRVAKIQVEGVVGYLHASGSELPTVHISDTSFLAKTAASCPSYLKPKAVEVKAPADPLQFGVKLNERLVNTERCWTYKSEISEVLYGSSASAFILKKMRDIEQAARRDGCLMLEDEDHD